MILFELCKTGYDLKIMIQVFLKVQKSGIYCQIHRLLVTYTGNLLY